jgi:chromosomal replication initiator protein
VVNGILTIPLPGQISNSPHEPFPAAPRLLEFVAGPENALAATAIRPYLEQAATAFNPLVLYGPHGSGKSHLAYGLAAWWSRHFPGARVCCLTAAQFAQEHVAALAAQALEAWRHRIRGLDLLIVEDIAQLGPKHGAQQELLHTLDALADRGTLVVITARTLPTHSILFLPALRSRLSAGLTVPLALPEAAARRAILERLTAQRNTSIPKRALHTLAEGLEVSVPALISAALELELALRIAPLSGDPQQQVRQVVAARAIAKMPSLRDIACLTAKYFGLKLTDLKSPSRRQPLVTARGVAMYLARQLTDKSLEQIGVFFGGRDHTTVINGCRRTEEMLNRDRSTRQAIAELKKPLVAS